MSNQTEWGRPEDIYPSWLWPDAIDRGLIAGNPTDYETLGRLVGHEYVNAQMHSIIELDKRIAALEPPVIEPPPPIEPPPVVIPGEVPGINGTPIFGEMTDTDIAGLEVYDGPTDLYNVPNLEGYLFPNRIRVRAGTTQFDQCAWRVAGGWISLLVDSGARAIVHESDLAGKNSNCQFGIQGTADVYRSKLAYFEDAIKLASGCVYDQNYIGPLEYLGDFTANPHEDCMQASSRTTNVKITRNNLRAIEADGSYDTTSCIIIKTDSGPQDDILVDGNHLEGGSYSIYGRDGGHGFPTNLRVINNVFHGGKYGIRSGEFTVWENNTDPAGNPV